MDRRTQYVRGVIWLGIILDGLSVLPYVFPKLMLGPLGVSEAMLTPVATYLLFHGGTFMLAWTILLMWTLQNPVARRFVLLLTVWVTVGLAASAAYLLTVEGIDRSGAIPLLILPTVVGGLFATAYVVAGSLRALDPGAG